MLIDYWSIIDFVICCQIELKIGRQGGVLDDADYEPSIVVTVCSIDGSMLLINDQLSIFVTDSESAENWEAEFISDADHDHARVFNELPSDWSEIDEYTIEFVIWCEITVHECRCVCTNQ